MIPAMRIGVLKEIKVHEYRVGLTPSSVREAVAHGHEVLVERGAGSGIGATDAVYEKAGAGIAALPGLIARDEIGQGRLVRVLPEAVGIPILELQGRKSRIAHPLQQAAGIGTTGVGDSDQQWQGRRLRLNQAIGWRAVAARDHATLRKMRIGRSNLFDFHPLKLACLQFCVKVGQYGF